MDRKAWLVITLCTFGLIANVYYANKYPPIEKAPAPAAVAPAAASATTAPAAATKPAATISSASGVTPSVPVVEETHTITRGTVTWHFSNKGGGIAKVVLTGTDNLTLNQFGKEPIGALRREAAGNDAVIYKVIEKSDKGITFEGTSADGIIVKKVYEVTEGAKSDEHLINLKLTLTNTGATAHKSEEYYLYSGAANSMRPDEALKPSFFWNDAGDATQKLTDSFSGGWFSTEQAEMRSTHTRLRFSGVMSRFDAIILSHESTTDKPGKVWATRFLLDHSTDKFKDLSTASKDYAIQSAMGLPPVDLAPAGTVTESYSIYAGPKEYHRLAALEGQRDFVMFYGMFGFISRLLTQVMRWMHDISGNWGAAIILLTLCIRTVLWWPQSKAQYSMKRMGLLGPKMKELQVKYKDDPQKQQVETMKLYKDYGVNPVGGCLPMLLQIPIFFGFYSVLQNAAELRGQPWLWVQDLSLPDTIYTLNFPVSLPLIGTHFDLNPLPLIMGVTMILQMKLTPQPATVDKTQKMMFTIMPFFFLFICYNFASALSLYWSTQNIFAIFQSYIMKLYMKEPVLEKVEAKPKAPPSNNPFFNPMNPNHKEKKVKPRGPKLGG